MGVPEQGEGQDSSHKQGAGDSLQEALPSKRIEPDALRNFRYK
jgi:hypothetical protein